MNTNKNTLTYLFLFIIFAGISNAENYLGDYNSSYETGLRVYFPLDINATDMSTFDRTATENNNIAYTSNSLNLTNNNESYLQVTTTPTTNYTSQNFTLSIWIYPLSYATASQNQFYPIRYEVPSGSVRSGTWGLTIGEFSTVNGKISLNTYDGSWHGCYSAQNVNLNKWNHITIVADIVADRQLTYLNGTLVNNCTYYEPSPLVPGYNFYEYIGRDSHTLGGDYFNGSIDEIYVWNRTLSADEISEIYLIGRAETSLYITNLNDSSVGNSWAEITWTTSIAANSSIFYGLSNNLPNEITNNTDVLTHSINITSLNHSTRYYYNVTSCIDNGTCVVNGPFNFTTASNVTPLEIQSISIQSKSQNWTVIEVVSNLNTNVSIDYGKTQALGTTSNNGTFAQTSTVNLTGLHGSTLYYYNVTSCIDNGTCVVNGTFNFTTSPVHQGAFNTSNSTIYLTDVNTIINILSCTWYYDKLQYTGSWISVENLTVDNPAIYTPRTFNFTASNKVYNCTTFPYNDSVIIDVISTSDTVGFNSANITASTQINGYCNLSYGENLTLQNSSISTTYTTQHTHSLTNLKNGTLYYYNLTCKDGNGNSVTKGYYNLSTLTYQNLTQINISHISEATSVKITALTDAHSKCNGSYGLNASLGTAFACTGTYSKSHPCTISGLSATTKYYYNVTCIDASLNTVTAGTYNFTTTTIGQVESSIDNMILVMGGIAGLFGLIIIGVIISMIFAGIQSGAGDAMKILYTGIVALAISAIAIAVTVIILFHFGQVT